MGSPVPQYGPAPPPVLHPMPLSDTHLDDSQAVPPSMPIDVWPPNDPETIRPSRTPELYPLSPIRSPTTVRLVDPVLGPFVSATELTTGKS